MNIIVSDTERVFHLQNDLISYIMTVLPGGCIGQLYFGSRLHHRDGFADLIEKALRANSAFVGDGAMRISPEYVRQEYPVYGTGDYRQSAVEILHEDGSRISDFRYTGYEVIPGKPDLPGLPATYAAADEASTLVLKMEDSLAGIRLEMFYTIFDDRGVITRSVRFYNIGNQTVFLTRAMSLCLDLPDSDYEWMQFSGAWGRERIPVKRALSCGIQSIESLRGHSSAQQNPFVILKRPNTDEFTGDALGFSFVYSGNFLALAQVDSCQTARMLMGIHPQGFSWKLEKGDTFQTPEAVIAFSQNGLNGLSQTFHDLYRSHLVRGIWRDQPRPILLNNWEATYFDFNEEKLLKIAQKAKECGVELFVLDDGWFGKRRSDDAGLGDWIPSKELLPDGISGLSEKIEALGLSFGLWIEPEMVNPDSDLYRAHPDWVLHVKGRSRMLSRNQLVLDFTRQEVIDHIYEMLHTVFASARISYVKWDMNRSISECGSAALPPDRQGEVFHRHILGVYQLYERLREAFPKILFESCASGGGRFDAGMLYYAPQAWTSDDTDAVERIRIQYGTSYGYPIVSMGSHVSAVPNHQVHRTTALKTRAEAAYFGTYGYELDLNKLSEEEQEEVCAYTAFMKEHRTLIQFGNFYRLLSPFENNDAAWITVSGDRKEAIAACYRTLVRPNAPFTRLKLCGLDPDRMYAVKRTGKGYAAEEIGVFYGDELMKIGLSTSDRSAGITDPDTGTPYDFSSWIFLIRTAEEES